MIEALRERSEEPASKACIETVTSPPWCMRTTTRIESGPFAMLDHNDVPAREDQFSEEARDDESAKHPIHRTPFLDEVRKIP